MIEFSSLVYEEAPLTQTLPVDDTSNLKERWWDSIRRIIQLVNRKVIEI